MARANGLALEAEVNAVPLMTAPKRCRGARPHPRPPELVREGPGN